MCGQGPGGCGEPVTGTVSRRGHRDDRSDEVSHGGVGVEGNGRYLIGDGGRRRAGPTPHGEVVRTPGSEPGGQVRRSGHGVGPVQRNRELHPRGEAHEDIKAGGRRASGGLPRHQCRRHEGGSPSDQGSGRRRGRRDECDHRVVRDQQSGKGRRRRGRCGNRVGRSGYGERRRQRTSDRSGRGGRSGRCRSSCSGRLGRSPRCSHRRLVPRVSRAHRSRRSSRSTRRYRVGSCVVRRSGRRSVGAGRGDHR